MPLYLRIITRNLIYRILPIILAIVWDYRNKPQKRMPTLLFLPVCILWPKQPKYYLLQKKFYYPT